MDPYIAKLETPERCEQYAKNIQGRSPEDAKAARRRAVELRAMKFSAQSDVERDALKAIYAYERTLWEKHGKPKKANRTWKMVRDRGIIPAVDLIVSRKKESAGYTSLVQMGLQEMSFEAVVLRHPESFSAQAVARSKERLNLWIQVEV